MIGISILLNLVKLVVDRARPDIRQLTGFSELVVPVGHAATSAAMFAAFALVLGRGRSPSVRAALTTAAPFGIAVAVAGDQRPVSASIGSPTCSPGSLWGGPGSRSARLLSVAASCGSEPRSRQPSGSSRGATQATAPPEQRVATTSLSAASHHSGTCGRPGPNAVGTSPLATNRIVSVEAERQRVGRHLDACRLARPWPPRPDRRRAPRPIPPRCTSASTNSPSSSTVSPSPLTTAENPSSRAVVGSPRRARLPPPHHLRLQLDGPRDEPAGRPDTPPHQRCTQLQRFQRGGGISSGVARRISTAATLDNRGAAPTSACGQSERR